MIAHFFNRWFQPKASQGPQPDLILERLMREKQKLPADAPVIGILAGNGSFPLRFAFEANKNGHRVVAVCHRGETSERIQDIADEVVWIRVGELGKILDTFVSRGVSEVAMAGGISRVRLFGGVKLDARGAALLMRLKSAKDDVIMRGIAEELESAGVKVVPCTLFLQDCLVREGVLTATQPTQDEQQDISVGVDALMAMGDQHIGQLVVVREGVIVAVEAVEGSDEAIRRGGKLGGPGSVVVKFSKPSQDLRFDVPTIGIRTIETMREVGCRVLAVESGRCLILDETQTVAAAEAAGISIVGCPLRS